MNGSQQDIDPFLRREARYRSDEWSSLQLEGMTYMLLVLLILLEVFGTHAVIDHLNPLGWNTNALEQTGSGV